MAPRPDGDESGVSALVAVKCDLCGGGDGPECVSACPTGSIFRVEPERDLAEVREVLGGPATAGHEARPAARLARVVLAFSALPPLVALARLGGASERFRWHTGALAGALALLLASQALVKRVQPVRAWLRRRMARALGPRGLSRLVVAHGALGLVAVATVLAHTGGRRAHGVAGVLELVFWLLSLSGVLGAVVYRSLPSRLSRLEREGTQREDHAAERDELEQRLFAGLSAQNAAVKELARRVIVPYARAPFGPLALVASGRMPREEEARLSARVRSLLGGRESERLRDAGGLVGAAVGLRVLVARRWLEALLGAWLPAHLVLGALFGALLALHVLGVVLGVAR